MWSSNADFSLEKPKQWQTGRSCSIRFQHGDRSAWKNGLRLKVIDMSISSNKSTGMLYGTDNSVSNFLSVYLIL